MTQYILRFYEAHILLIRSITVNVISAINNLYIAAGVVHDVVQCFPSLLSKQTEFLTLRRLMSYIYIYIYIWSTHS